MRRLWLAVALAAAVLASSSIAIVVAQEGEGVKVGRASFVRRLIPVAQIENAGAQQYVALKNQANAKRALLPPSHPQAQRLKRIFDDILPHVEKWNPRAKEWTWEVSLIASRNINAFCLPGGKIAFFIGILEQLRLTDDEAAMIMGHEMAHAYHADRQPPRRVAAVRTGGRGHRRRGQQPADAEILARRREGSRPDRHGAGGARGLRPGGRDHAVAQDGGRGQGCTAAVDVDASGERDAGQADPGQPKGRRPAV